MLNINLEDHEVNFLLDFVRKGHKSARELTRARILLMANQQKMGTEIAETLGVCRNTVLLVKKRYVEEGLPNALSDKPRSGQPLKYTEKHAAEVIALACSSSPDGSKRWSLALLTEELRKKEEFETISKESIRLILKKSKTKPWLRRMWCIQTIDSEYRNRMYDILNLYEEDYDPKKPLICLDEKSKQLLQDKRMTIHMKPGMSEKYEYEYTRNGTANIFMAVEFKAGKRMTQVTKRRTMTDFAQFVKIDRGGELLKTISMRISFHFP